MRHAYLLTNKNGIQEWNIQKYPFTEKQMLDAFSKYDIVRVEYHRPIPDGHHLCACGNIVEGTNDDVLCKECRESYGHVFAHEL